MVTRYCLNCDEHTRQHVKSTRFTTVYECSKCGNQEHENPDNCVRYETVEDSKDPQIKGEQTTFPIGLLKLFKWS